MHRWSFGHSSSLSYPQGEQGTKRHDRTHVIAARPPFLRLMAAGIDREGRRATGRREVRDPRIVGNHQSGRSDDFRGSKPVGNAGNIGDPGVSSFASMIPSSCRCCPSEPTRAIGRSVLSSSNAISRRNCECPSRAAPNCSSVK